MTSKIVTTFENKQVELVFNESFLCPHRDVGVIDITFGPEVENWTCRIIFKNDTDRPAFSTSWEYGVDGVSIKAIFYNWMGSSWAELTVPKSLLTADFLRTYYVKLRSEANSDQEYFRKIHISAWKVI